MSVTGVIMVLYRVYVDLFGWTLSLAEEFKTLEFDGLGEPEAVMTLPK
jgi:hypothetical protein